MPASVPDLFAAGIAEQRMGRIGAAAMDAEVPGGVGLRVIDLLNALLEPIAHVSRSGAEVAEEGADTWAQLRQAGGTEDDKGYYRNDY